MVQEVVSSETCMKWGAHETKTEVQLTRGANREQGKYTGGNNGFVQQMPVRHDETTTEQRLERGTAQTRM